MINRNIEFQIIIVIFSIFLVFSTIYISQANNAPTLDAWNDYDPDIYTQVKSVNISNVYNSQNPGSWFSMRVMTEVWNPTSQDITLNFTSPDTPFDYNEQYPCGISFDVNSDTGYDFSLWSISPFMTPKCYFLSINTTISPGLTQGTIELRGFNYGIKNDYFSGNLSLSLKFVNSISYILNDKFDQFYNLSAEIVDDEITLQTDEIPSDWGGLNTSQGLQMRIVSLDRTYHYYDEAIWSIPVYFESEVVGSGSVNSPCTHLYSYSVIAWLKENRSNNEFNKYYDSGPDTCSTAVTTHTVSPITIKRNLEINIDFNSTYIPQGNYTFRLGLGYSPNTTRFTVEIKSDQYFTSYYEENQNLVYITTEPLDTITQSNTNPSPLEYNIILLPVLIFGKRKFDRSNK